MAQANHYCRSCDTHFRASPEQHAETYHDGGVFQGVTDGNWKDWERKEQYRRSEIDDATR